MILITKFFGFSAVILHVTAILFVGFHDPNFWHPHHAISDPGMLGVNNNLIYNSLSFIMPGLFIIGFAWGLMKSTGFHIRSGGVLLILGGTSFLLIGICPFPRSEHFIFVALSIIFFVSAIVLVSWNLIEMLNWMYFKMISIFLAMFILGNFIILYIEFPYPGYYQKISLVMGLIWLVFIARNLETIKHSLVSG